MHVSDEASTSQIVRRRQTGPPKACKTLDDDNLIQRATSGDYIWKGDHRSSRQKGNQLEQK